jgi:hypothetical protein
MTDGELDHGVHSGGLPRRADRALGDHLTQEDATASLQSNSLNCTFGELYGRIGQERLGGLRLLRLGRNEPYQRCRRRDIPLQRPDHFDAGLGDDLADEGKPKSVFTFAKRRSACGP